MEEERDRELEEDEEREEEADQKLDRQWPQWTMVGQWLWFRLSLDFRPCSSSTRASRRRC